MTAEPRPRPDQDWHATAIEEAYAALGSGAQGLSRAEARRRLEVEGPNRLAERARPSALLRFARQFHNLLIYVLLAAAMVSLALDHPVDAAVILAVVIANAIIGYMQEGKAERALEAIKGMIDPQASVLRDGQRVTVPAQEVVRGDVVLIEAGDRVPADLRLVRCRNLRIDEAILTGESVPVEKAIEPVAQAAPLGERSAMAFSGTFVATGTAQGVAVATGTQTELGRISTLLGAVQELKTPLLEQMDRFARQLTLFILGVSVLAFLFAILVQGYPMIEAFMAMVGLAVAAIPEGLPAVLTITLAIGVQRMARRNAIIRRLPAVETLGSVSVICSDKTGTLTRNEMTATAVVTAAGAYRVTGVGYEPHGAIEAEDAAADGAADGAGADTALGALLRAALLCNDAELRESGTGGWIVDGDPMEGALVALAGKAGLDPRLLRKQLPRTDEIPFDAEHRFMATLHHSHDGEAFIVVKGAPERLLEMCRSEHGPAGERAIDLDAWRAVADRLAGRGQRVLAFATRPARPGQHDLGFADVEGGLALLGCVGFIDPPRAEAVAAVAECKSAGIRVVMITGDHAVTARAIGRQLGLAEAPEVRTGRSLDPLDDERLRTAARDTSVFARTTPEHKLRLVQALQAEGLTVAMTGDGVNDAPALKRADVGIAMGGKGTEVAKEAAEMVLADDNFASIVAAVREGRTVYDNIVKVIGWTLPTNGGQALTILAAVALGLPLPVTPVQILWINMVCAVALGLTLAFEPTEPGAMTRPPRAREAALLTGVLLWQIVLVSCLFVTGAFGIFYWAEAKGAPIEEARTLVVNTIVVMGLFYLFNVRYVHGPSLTVQGLLGTPAVLIGVGATILLQLGFTYLPAMQAVFHTRPVSLVDGMIVIGIGVALMLLVEIEKHLRTRIAAARARRARA